MEVIGSKDISPPLYVCVWVV